MKTILEISYHYAGHEPRIKVDGWVVEVPEPEQAGHLRDRDTLYWVHPLGSY